MNYQKLFDAIAFVVIAICMIVGFITPLYLYDIVPDNKKVDIQLRPGEIPPDAVRVFDVRDIETVGEVKRVFGTYDFCSCNETYVSVLFNRQKYVLEFSVRGITSNETFDYRFQKSFSVSNEWMATYNKAGNILLFNNESVVMEYYKDTFIDVIMAFVFGVIFAVILGIISYLLMSRLEIILKSNPVQGIHEGAKRLIGREKTK